MKHTHKLKMSRPSLLVKAARSGAARYQRDRDFPHHLRRPGPDDPDRIVKCLVDAEQDFDMERRAGTCTYDIAGHIAVLSALIAELSGSAEPERP